MSLVQYAAKVITDRNQLLVMNVLLRYNNRYDGCFPSYETLVMETGLSEWEVRVALKSLKKAGHLRIKAGGKRFNRRYPRGRTYPNHYFPFPKLKNGRLPDIGSVIKPSSKAKKVAKVEQPVKESSVEPKSAPVIDDTARRKAEDERRARDEMLKQQAAERKALEEQQAREKADAERAAREERARIELEERQKREAAERAASETERQNQFQATVSFEEEKRAAIRTMPPQKDEAQAIQWIFDTLLLNTVFENDYNPETIYGIARDFNDIIWVEESYLQGADWGSCSY